MDNDIIIKTDGYEVFPAEILSQYRIKINKETREILKLKIGDLVDILIREKELPGEPQKQFQKFSTKITKHYRITVLEGVRIAQKLKIGAKVEVLIKKSEIEDI